MDRQDWNRVDELLNALLERAPEEREAFLRQACGGEELLEHEVRSLLTLEQQTANFLEAPAIEIAARTIAVQQERRPALDDPSLIDHTISHYRILEKLGRGGMGVVWKAYDTRLDRFVALKFLPGSANEQPERKQRFVQEARSASALNHPNIITIYDIGEAELDGQASDFIVMEFVPGKTLDEGIQPKGMPLSKALRCAVQLADALTAAHAAGIVHRDLKPGNIMVSENGSVKVLDFGLAKLSEQPAAHLFSRTGAAEMLETGQGVILGTIFYMSPEQAAGKRADAQADIFSFGAVLYEVITGRRAFAGDSAASILTAILRDDPQPIAEVAPGVPREIDRIVRRCLEKDPARRYQHTGDLKLDLQQAEQEFANGSAVRQYGRGRSNVSRSWTLAALALVAVATLTAWWIPRGQQAELRWNMTRLTADPGLSGFPALSPDGKLAAYSSDHDGSGQDLYVKQVAGGQAIRLTSDGAGNTTPDFSPDGSKLVFRSNRNGGGIYLIPALGGEARLLARDGLNPKFSPDGSQVAYWIGAPLVAPTVPGTGTVWIVPVSGGAPQRVGRKFTVARYPLWLPDGKRLLFLGYGSSEAFENSSIDWWLSGTNGDDGLRTGAYKLLGGAGLRGGENAGGATPSLPKPSCWSTAGDAVVFSAMSGDTRNLWRIGISARTGKAGALERLTTGPGNEVDPSCSSGSAVAFAAAETRTDVWRTGVDLERGTSTGDLERITDGPAFRYYVSLSQNGRYAAFSSTQAGQPNIRLRDLVIGKESNVANSSFVQRYPLLNAAGDRVVFSVYETDKRGIYLSVPGGTPEKLCEGCLRATDWSQDEKSLLVFGGNPYKVDLLDIGSHQQRTILEHPRYSLLYARFSPDNRWVSFTVRTEPNRAYIAVAPLDAVKPVPESAWIQIADVGTEDWANWSPDGKTLYFTSPRDGRYCVWGQRIQEGSLKPAGEPFPLLHLHGRVSYRQGGWSVAAGRIAMVLAEDTGNLWIMSKSGGR